jgi:hypothetical protein
MRASLVMLIHARELSRSRTASRVSPTKSMRSIERVRMLTQVLDTVVPTMLYSNMSLKPFISLAPYPGSPCAASPRAPRSRRDPLARVPRPPSQFLPRPARSLHLVEPANTIDTNHSISTNSCQNRPRKSLTFSILRTLFRAIRISLNLKDIARFLTHVFSTGCAHFSWKSPVYSDIRIAYRGCARWLRNSTLPATSGTCGAIREERHDRPATRAKKWKCLARICEAFQLLRRRPGRGSGPARWCCVRRSTADRVESRGSSRSDRESRRRRR